MTLAASALAGGDCIDDADVLRTGGTAGAIGCVLKAPSGDLPAQHVRQLDRVSRELVPGLGRWRRTRRRAVDHRPGLLCETYGLAKEGARHHGWSAGLSPAAGHRRRNR